MRFMRCAVAMLVCFVCVAMRAQTAPYHAEVKDGWVVLVNDSQKPIEAFVMSAKCGTVLVNGTTEDALQTGGGKTLHPYDHQPHTFGRVAAGEHGLTFFSLAKQHSECEWNVRVDAVIYVDGTYGGSEDDVRKIEAQREGMQDSLTFWKTRMAAADATAWVDMMRAEATARKAKDQSNRMYPGCGQKPMACAYWQGRLQVDDTLLINMRPDGDQQHLRQQQVARWQAKFDTDEAFSVLENRLARSSELPVQ